MSGERHPIPDRLEPFLDSGDLLDDPERLRRRFAREGYLFVRGLLPREDVTPMAELVLRTAIQTGFVAPDGTPRRSTPPYDDPEYVRLQQVAYPSVEMDAMRRHPRLQAILRALVGDDIGMGRGDIVRVRAPGARTRPHQDRNYLPGDQALVAAWFPLFPCPVVHGPIAVLPGSHVHGLLPHAGPVRSEEGVAEVPSGVWRSNDLFPGDAVLFGDFTVHQGLPTTAEVTRLSVDFRFSAGGGVPPSAFGSSAQDQ